MLDGMLKQYDEIAGKALSARIFPIACGLSLKKDNVVHNIAAALVNRPHWGCLVSPSTSTLYPEEWGLLLPRLFAHLFYLGTPLVSALKRIWAADRRVSYHTDMIVYERKPSNSGHETGGEPGVNELALEERVSITKYTFGSVSSRPYGYPLPIPWSLCPCAPLVEAGGEKVKWKKQDGRVQEKHNEVFYRYRSSCRHVYLRIAICPKGVSLTSAAGVQIVQQPYDFRAKEFPLDSRDAYKWEVTKVIDPSSKQMSKPRDHKGPWTRRGQGTGLHPGLV
ncbi:hypothetical protein FRC12_001632 [Ceratobasidium sp. 428]|nr:hypothetical protein FRC12_001632 [Ceratobasidium sp. 428]